MSAYIAAASELAAPATVGRDVSVLHAIFRSAQREELIESNPAAGAERPKVKRRRWRILQPVEVPRVAKAFTDDQARVIFLTLMLTGIRRHELQGLRWRDIDLIENRLRVTDSKTEQGIRSIAISPALAEELWGHRGRTRYQGDDEYVFTSPTGRQLRARTYAEQFRAALKQVGIHDHMRPFHDARHSSLTNLAASGANPTELMATAGHANMSTTKTYLHLAGIVFPDAAERLERRLLGGQLSTKLSTNLSESEGTSEGLRSLNHAGSDLT